MTPAELAQHEARARGRMEEELRIWGSTRHDEEMAALIEIIDQLRTEMEQAWKDERSSK
jgi:hypothetical protein